LQQGVIYLPCNDRYHRRIELQRRPSMRAIRDYDADLKALADKARKIKERHIRQLGELVIATGANVLAADELAGLLLGDVEVKEAGKREVWAKRGQEFFLQRLRKSRPHAANDGAGDQANDDAAQPLSSGQGAA
jgi:hypothetical protein